MTNLILTALDSVSKGEIEAARTLGMSNFKAFRYVILPQLIKNILPNYKNQFIASMQETSVVGYLAVMDLTKASSIVTARTLDAMFGLICISIIYLLLGYAGMAIINIFNNKKHLTKEDIHD